jgi:hypothetical protein
MPGISLMPTNRLDEQKEILEEIGNVESFDTVTLSQMFGQGKTTMATVLMTMMSERDLRAEAAPYSHIFSSTLLYIPLQQSSCCATCTLIKSLERGLKNMLGFQVVPARGQLSLSDYLQSLSPRMAALRRWARSNLEEAKDAFFRGDRDAAWLSREQVAGLHVALAGLAASPEAVLPTPQTTARWAHIIGSSEEIVLFLDEIGKLITTGRVKVQSQHCSVDVEPDPDALPMECSLEREAQELATVLRHVKKQRRLVSDSRALYFAWRRHLCGLKPDKTPLILAGQFPTCLVGHSAARKLSGASHDVAAFFSPEKVTPVLLSTLKPESIMRTLERTCDDGQSLFEKLMGKLQVPSDQQQLAAEWLSHALFDVTGGVPRSLEAAVRGLLAEDDMDEMSDMPPLALKSQHRGKYTAVHRLLARHMLSARVVDRIRETRGFVEAYQTRGRSCGEAAMSLLAVAASCNLRLDSGSAVVHPFLTTAAMATLIGAFVEAQGPVVNSLFVPHMVSPYRCSQEDQQAFVRSCTSRATGPRPMRAVVPRALPNRREVEDSMKRGDFVAAGTLFGQGDGERLELSVAGAMIHALHVQALDSQDQGGKDLTEALPWLNGAVPQGVKLPPSMCSRLQIGRMAGMRTAAKKETFSSKSCDMVPLGEWKTADISPATLGVEELAKLMKSAQFEDLMNNVVMPTTTSETGDVLVPIERPGSRPLLLCIECKNVEKGASLKAINAKLQATIRLKRELVDWDVAFIVVETDPNDPVLELDGTTDKESGVKVSIRRVQQVLPRDVADELQLGPPDNSDEVDAAAAASASASASASAASAASSSAAAAAAAAARIPEDLAEDGPSSDEE